MTSIHRRALLIATATMTSAVAFGLNAATRVKEIRYGANRSQRLNVYLQDGLKAAPVLLFVHGGAWKIGDKNGVNALPDYASRNGFLLLSTNYRMTPEVDAGGCAEDVAAAFAWAKEHAEEYGGDPSRIYLIGHSAGAHLVALIGVDPMYLKTNNLEPKDIAGVIALDGAAYNAVQQLRIVEENKEAFRPRRTERRRGPSLIDIDEIMPDMFKDAFEKRAAALSPTLLARTGLTYPPMLILFVPRRVDGRLQSNALGAALNRSGGKAVVLPATDQTHADINRSFGRKGDVEGELAAAFIRSGQLPPAR